MIQAIVFDMGHTLLRQDTLDWKRMEKAGFINQINVLRKRDVRKPSVQEWSTLFYELREPLEKTAESDFIEVNSEKIFHYMLDFYEIPPDITPTMMVSLLYHPIMVARQLFPDVSENLQRLRDLRLPLGLISNTLVPAAICRPALERLNILHYFQFTFFSSEFIYRKPHPAMFDMAIRRLKLKPDRILYVGDRLLDDVAGAAGVGMKTAWLNRDSVKTKSRLKPDFILRSLSDIPEKLLS